MKRQQMVSYMHLIIYLRIILNLVRYDSLHWLQVGLCFKCFTIVFHLMKAENGTPIIFAFYTPLCPWFESQ